ncbi:MAG: SUMF1/EgtB/PvdO family nonheme iron enzyme [Candidatus Coatesbacteria bacterium]|nr:SUMF1/EgtB/PvdO family nonheme iron enzyme [Candidatus Coatesbacteria bacterium]
MLALFALVVMTCALNLTAEEVAAPKPPQTATAAVHRPGEPRTFDGIDFVWIPPGEFTMGSSKLEQDWAVKCGAKPQNVTGEDAHKVEIKKSFWMSAYEITNAEFCRFRASHDSGKYAGYPLNKPDQPVVLVAWDDANAFAEWLSKKSGAKYRLPTEAEWEYACRAGATTTYQWGDNPNDGRDWTNGPDMTFSRAFEGPELFGFADGYVLTSPVGTFRRNAWGLYDMTGNVWEWCADKHEANDDVNVLTINPLRPSVGPYRSVRGGSWGTDFFNSRIACRYYLRQAYFYYDIGFRVVREDDSKPGTAGATN